MNILRIKKFKCFKSIDINLNNFTILVGSNGFGKSSTIQSILLLKQAIDSTNSKVFLNDVYSQNLGTQNSVQNKVLEENFFEIGLHSDGICEDFAKFQGDEDNNEIAIGISEIKSKNLSPKEFYYLSAERQGPRISQPLAHMDFLNVGVFGQYTAQVVASEFKPEMSRYCPEIRKKSLESHVNGWLDAIFPKVHVSSRVSYDTLTAQVLVDNAFAKNNFATNIGFGISYVLPIIVTCLVAKKGSFVIIENPEAHLHPAAQAAMGRFLATMSNAGLKIIVETHSDHILEGVQLYVASHKDANKYITIDCFGIKEGDDQPHVDAISFTESAEFSRWPEGFMDQSQKDFLELRRMRTVHV